MSDENEVTESGFVSAKEYRAGQMFFTVLNIAIFGMVFCLFIHWLLG